MEVNLFLKKVLLLLLSTLVGILSGCSAGKLSVPSGILATDQTVADEYMTDNSFLTARYCIGNIPFLRYVGEKKCPVILSTGMSTLADVDISVQALEQGGATDISLLHCTTNYPCPFEDVNLTAMDTLKNAFGMQVGYSDHTIGI